MHIILHYIALLSTCNTNRNAKLGDQPGHNEVPNITKTLLNHKIKKRARHFDNGMKEDIRIGKIRLTCNL